MSEREHAHELIDRLPEPQLAGLVKFLEAIVDPMAAAFRRAPFDDEPLSAEEAAAIEEGVLSIDRQGSVPIEDVLVEFGFRIEELQNEV